MYNTPYHSPFAEDSRLMLLETTVVRVVKVNQNGKVVECKTKTMKALTFFVAMKQAVLLVIIICEQL